MIEIKSRNYYLSQPCFILVLERSFGKNQFAYSTEELAKYYAIWLDGLSMGHYCDGAHRRKGCLGGRGER